MKVKKNNKYFTISVYAFGVLAAASVFIFTLLYPSKLLGMVKKIIYILTPLIIGFSIAFILNPVMNFFENKVFKNAFKGKKQNLAKRGAALVCTYIIFFGLISAFFAIVIPSLVSSVTDLINNVPSYYDSGVEILNNLLDKYNLSVEFLQPFTEITKKAVDALLAGMKDILPQIYGIAISATSVVRDIFVGIVFSIYMLASKEVFARQGKKLLAAYTKPVTEARVLRVSSLAYNTFSKYFSGYIFDSMIVGLICYTVMTIFGWPYPALISIIIGVSNMIPIFGPIIGAIPSIIIIMLVNPWHALFFCIFIILLQQIDGNFICPRILGQRIGISPFWVMLALVVGGSLLGVFGMIVGVPTFAVVYSLMRGYLDRRISEKNRKNDTEEENAEN